MSLVNCQECGSMISSLAEECPHCGAPRHVAFRSYNPYRQQQTQPVEDPIVAIDNDRPSKWEFYLAILAGISLLIGIVLVFCSLQY